MTAYLGTIVSPDFIGTKAGAKAVWQFITGDNIDKTKEKSVIYAIFSLYSCELGVILDTRAMNGKTKDLAFDPFWKELEHQ
jgi:hypothetical protein